MTQHEGDSRVVRTLRSATFGLSLCRLLLRVPDSERVQVIDALIMHLSDSDPICCSVSEGN
jgi:hypothetical protein